MAISADQVTTASDCELISSILRIKQDKAAKIYASHDYSLRAVLDSTRAGCLVKELSQRYLSEGLKHGEALTDVGAVRNYLMHRLRGYPYEVFACLFLDNKHRVIEYEEMFRGTIDSASVHPREVVRAAMSHNAAAVIFAHNHPSGVAEPSQADHRITDRLKDALNLVDVRVLDHFVIGDSIDNVVSFAERGYL